MKYIIACDSDVGRKKDINQDAVYSVNIYKGGQEIVFSILCDGMGGFEQGEVASTSVVVAYKRWFKDSFINRLEENLTEEDIFSEWDMLMMKLNKNIHEYGLSNGIKLGTTATIFMIYNGKYYIMNIGDTRAYKMGKEVVRLTKDHSWVQREVEEGRMTLEEARLDKRKNRLLKSIGGASKTSADFYSGVIESDVVYMMCCDGIRNKVNDDELLYFFHPHCMTNVEVMENNMKFIFELNKKREENDNMTVVLIKENENTVSLDEIQEDGEILFEKVIVGSYNFIDIK